MAKKRKKSRKTPKTTTRTITKRIEVVPKEYEANKLKKEIAELEEKRKQTPKGFKGTLQRMTLNKRISEKSTFLRSQDRLRNIKQTTELTKSQVNLEQARADLKKAREKSKVNFEGFGSATSNQIKMENIFK